MSLSIYLLQGGQLPSINPGYAFSSPIAIELLLVPLAFGIAYLERARALMPAHVHVLVNLGVAYSTVGRLQEARDALERAARIKPASLLHSSPRRSWAQSAGCCSPVQMPAG